MTASRHFARPLAAAARLLVVFTVIGSALGCGPASSPAPTALAAAADDNPSPPANQVTLSEDALRASGITVAAAVTESRVERFETPAVLTVNETRTARIGSVVEGVVSGADVQVGDRVRRGQRLASLHSHAVHDAWAGYRRAIADRQRARAELSYAASAEGRASRLLAAKAASQQELERAQTDRATAEQAVAIAESEVRRSLDELEHLGIAIDQVDAATHQDAVPVLAPIGGVVLERLVTASTAVTVGTPLYVMSDLTSLWAIAEIDEVHLPRLSVGQSANVTVAAYPGESFPARVVAIGERVNPETRRVTARIEVDNRMGRLKPEMFAAVNLATGEARDAVVVPAAAVQALDGHSVVFLETAPGTFQPRTVTLGEDRDGRVAVTGLEPGTRLAIGGTFLLKSKLLEADLPE
jgi:cobalt-zinc-cadmium efflux system membrane fusion protein